MERYNVQVETVRATLTGKIKGYESGLINLKVRKGISEDIRKQMIHGVEFTLRELKEVLEQLENFDRME
jgi:hypothetical protein